MLLSGMLDDIHVSFRWLQQVFLEVITDEIHVVGTPHTVVFARQHHHVEALVVLDEGAVVECGTHEELLARRGHYFALYSKQ